MRFCVCATGVEVVEASRNASETMNHTTYTCDGTESNLTECSSADFSFVCGVVAKVICLG